MGSYVYQGSMPELQQQRSFDMGQQLQEAQLQNAILGNQQGQWQFGEQQRNRASEVALEQWMQQNPNASPEQIMRKSIEFGAQPPGGVGQLYGGQLQREQWRQQFNPALYNARYGPRGTSAAMDPYQAQAGEDLSNLPLTQSALEGELAQRYATMANPPKSEEGNPISPASAAKDAWPAVFNQRMSLSEQAIPGFVAGEQSLPFIEAIQSLDEDLAQNSPEALIEKAVESKMLQESELEQYIQLVNQRAAEMQAQDGGGGFIDWLSSAFSKRGGRTGRVGR